MRTVIFFLGVAGLLYVTGGFAETGGNDIFKIMIQNFTFMKVINTIPMWGWCITLGLDIFDIIK